MTGIYDTTIFTSNVEELASFYDKLGFTRAIDSPDLVVFSMPNQDFSIHTSDTREHAAVGLTFYVDDLDAIQERLAREGIAYDGPQMLVAGLSGVALKDLNGNRINLVLPRGH